MASLEKFNNPNVYHPKPTDVPLSHVARANGFLFLMGCGARNVDGTIEGNDVKTQARKCMQNAREILATCGADFSHVVRIECFLVNIEDAAAFNEAYREFINDEPPARAMVFIKGFRDTSMLCEVVVTAVDPKA